MNIMILAAAASGGSSAGGIVGDSCAFFLFIAGGVSLMIAGYLLYKQPKAQPVRYARRY